MATPVNHRNPFVLLATDHGTMLVNRLDVKMTETDRGFGVGWSLLESGHFEYAEIDMVNQLLDLRRKECGDGVLVVDCGANIGVHTISWARHLMGWGTVIAIEPQEMLYYALAGNIVLNNCFNASAVHAAVGAEKGVLKIPTLDYTMAGSFGSLELRKNAENEDIGQPVSYEKDLSYVRTMTIDSMGLSRLDMLKIDVEGMEMEVLQGAAETIVNLKPIIMVEFLKSDVAAIQEFLKDHGYKWYPFSLIFLAIHKDDSINQFIREVADAA